MLYCEFYGQDLFLHTRAQWAELTLLAKGEGPAVATLTCPDCAWTLPGVKAMRSLLATVPYTADFIVVGYDYLFADLWKDRLLGEYQNDYWRLDFYHDDAGVVATLQARHTNFGEILAASLTPMVRRGASAVYFAGPAAIVDPKVDAADLVAPTDFVTFEGGRLTLRNVLAGRKRTLFSDLPSPLLATREWLRDARGHGVIAFDGEMARVAEQSGGWARLNGGVVDVGIGAVLGGLESLHPEEDRALYTVEYANQAGRESAKAQFRDAVLSALKDAARDKSRCREASRWRSPRSPEPRSASRPGRAPCPSAGPNPSPARLRFPDPGSSERSRLCRWRRCSRSRSSKPARSCDSGPWSRSAS